LVFAIPLRKEYSRRWPKTKALKKWVVSWFGNSLCKLCVLCVSVVSLGWEKTTTETQRAQSLHREEFKLGHHKKVEAGDPRYRLPLSQLDSPFERGQVRAGVYARIEFLAMIPATRRQLLFKKDLPERLRLFWWWLANCGHAAKEL